ncbi:hypothetical protein Hanom_Chr09g00786421 [Helianthus anomalus]
MFLHLTKRTKFLVRLRSFIRRTNINEISPKQFTIYLLNVRFIYSYRFSQYPRTLVAFMQW